MSSMKKGGKGHPCKMILRKIVIKILEKASSTTQFSSSRPQERQWKYHEETNPARNDHLIPPPILLALPSSSSLRSTLPSSSPDMEFRKNHLDIIAGDDHVRERLAGMIAFYFKTTDWDKIWKAHWSIKHTDLTGRLILKAYWSYMHADLANILILQVYWSCRKSDIHLCTRHDSWRMRLRLHPVTSRQKSFWELSCN